ncbi:hypothetical protein GCM10009555_042440 [Acrocarpospora macrocephala]|uniref:Uncharacterized protein n=1 Tax=Acrocarpospora macrocephala TaxID=150177 RepID=A0A5M3WXL5_9ACTN|nr:hypothetical protein [Acrocarpospora macrocephala]GES13674.1 hypothetical protein Amac_072710 [Acrocarpospora macrocephala]
MLDRLQRGAEPRTEGVGIVALVCRSRHVGFHVMAMLLVSATCVIWGQNTLLLPGGNETLPLAILMPVPYACIVASMIRSSMHSFENTASLSIARLDFYVITLALVLTLLLAVGSLALGGTLGLAPLVVRNIVFWSGVGFTSAALVGRSLGWVLPILLLVPLYESGRADSDGQIPLWAIARHPADSSWSWFVTALVVAAGVIMIGRSSAWRGSRFSRFPRLIAMRRD